MIRAVLPLALFLALSPASAAERRPQVGSFERVRVSGPFEVTFTSGSPGARVIGDAQAVEAVEVRAEGSTLTVRAAASGWGERPRSVTDAPVKIVLSSPTLTDASVVAGGRLSMARVKGARLSLSVNGAGSIAVAEMSVDRVDAALLGAGGMILAGKAGMANLRTNGAGRIDAAGLLANQVTVVVDGPGETRASARYSANVMNMGLGTVTIAGKPKCKVRAPAGGVVRCGS